VLENLLGRAINTTPLRSVLAFGHQSWTAAQLDAEACRIAASLGKSGLEAMDRVAVLLPNLPETVFTYLACFKGNYVVVPLDYRHQPPQLNYALSHSGASILIVHHERLAELEQDRVTDSVSRVYVVGDQEAPDYPRFDDLRSGTAIDNSPGKIESDQLCMMIYTSGTTSRPKGVTFTRGAIEEGIRKYLARVPMLAEDVAIVAAPIARPMALRSQLLPILFVGGCARLLERFEVNSYVAALRQSPAPTMLGLLPAAWAEVLRHPDIGQCNFRSVRMCLTGGDTTSSSVHHDFRRITGLELTEQLGSSEAGPIAINPPFGRKKTGSVGLPMYGVQVCIVDSEGNHLADGQTGGIVVQSDYMMEGYWNDTALTRKTIHAGQIHTGDLGRFDEDGYLWFMGRNRDLIVRGGSNISPLEVETVLRSHPQVAEACVVGVSHEELGQEVYAFVKLRPNAAISAAELQSFAARNLASYMVPAHIRLVDEMPLKGAGKIDRDRLKWRAETGLDEL
jgi:acyl-CoA synthetase (AMP-forming)/AMP-acid ligase II